MGTLKQPRMEFAFTQKARTFKERSKNNIIIFITEPTVQENKIIELETLDDVMTNKDIFKDNLQSIKDCFMFEPSPCLVTVYVVKSEPDMKELLEDVKNTREIAYVIYPTASAKTQKAIVDWIKIQSKTNKAFKTIVVGEDNADTMEIVNLDKSQKVFYKDINRKETDIKTYIPSLASVLSGSGATRGVTYTKLKNLQRVTQPSNIDESINSGHLVLINDEKDVRIALGINSKTTLEKTETDDLKFLEVMETIGLIKRDLSNIFKEKYVETGRKNSADLQQQFLTDVNLYFKKLADEEILARDFKNYAEIDIEAMRKALIDNNCVEAKTWDETKVANTIIKRDIFICAKIKVSESVTNLQFNTTIF